MAKASYKFPFNYIRGKLDWLVACHGKKLSYIRTYAPYDHSRKITELEANLRYNFKRAVLMWRLFSKEWKALYKEFAYYSTKNKRLSLPLLNGYSVFLQEYVNMVTGCDAKTCTPGACSACPPGKCKFREFSHAEADYMFFKAMELWEAGAPKEEAFRQAKEYVLEMRKE